MRVRQTEVQVGIAGRHAAPGRAHHEALLDQVGLQHILNGAALFGNGRGQTVHPDRATVKFLYHGQQQATIEVIKAFLVDAQHVQGPVGDLGR